MSGGLARGSTLPLRRGLLLVAAPAALTGLLAGLARVGLPMPWGSSYALEHGPLLAVAVFGTIIALERAVALGQRWAYAAPMAGALAAAAMLGGQGWAPWAASASALGLALINVVLVRKQLANFTALMLAGSALLLAGDLLWALGEPIARVVPSWMAFFVLTIAAERLELSRLAPTPRWAKSALVALASGLGLATCALLAELPGAARALGATMGLLGAWQLRFDLARRTLRMSGLPRFTAASVLLGAGWLVISGALLVAFGLPRAGPVYDAALHGVFVGYVLSMVIAHAPIILPAVAHLRLPYHRAFWIAPAILHLGLLARVLGDLLAIQPLREFGSIANVLALLAFAIAVFWARRARR
ncbi:MAG: hypothetical protein OEY14_01245 [Myxococcales bacterium]|nr:hypothetical protein [Myxococcales bacterium]